MMMRALSCFASLVLAAAAAAQDDTKLKVGSDAPAIDGLEFVQGELVATPKVRVVEFWATWCGPCRQSIPHINELFQANAGKGLEVIGISDETREKVEPFIRKQGGRMSYTVAIDPEKKMSQAFMQAAGQNGIPCAFVIGQNNKIVYIGHPMKDEFVRAVKLSLEGRYDPVLSRKAEPILEAARRAVKTRNFKDAYKRYDEVIALSPSVFTDAALEKYRVMVNDERDTAGANALANALLREFTEAADAGALRDLANTLSTDPRVSVYDLDLALRCAEAMQKASPGGDPWPMATLASVWYAKGDFTKAVENQRKAVRVAAPSAKGAFKSTLESYELAQKRGTKVPVTSSVPSKGDSTPATVPADGK